MYKDCLSRQLEYPEADMRTEREGAGSGSGLGSGRQPFVSMVEPADLREGNDLATTRRLCRMRFGGVLVQRKMRSGSVAIIEVRNKDPSQMPFIQDDHVVQAFASPAADQAFRH